jgi:hypothetical protein
MKHNITQLEKEFVEYTEALELKQLGFDEPCFGYYEPNKEFKYINWEIFKDFPYLAKNSEWEDLVAAPTYSQAFRWFRKKGYRFSVIIDSPLAEEESHYIEIWFEKQFLHESHYIYKTYEDAELGLLKKLIEIVKEKQQ